MARLQIALFLSILLLGCVIPDEGTYVPEEPEINTTTPHPQINQTQNNTQNQSQNHTGPVINITITEPPTRLPAEDFTVGNPDPAHPYDISALERKIFDKVNAERIKTNVSPLARNDDLAYTAKLHSLSLAKENIQLTESSLFCKMPFIHHEGFDYGLYEIHRLYNQSIYYFSVAGENIFIVSSWEKAMTHDRIQECPENGVSIIEHYGGPNATENIKAEYQDHLSFTKSAVRVNWTRIDWLNEEGLASTVVEGWMESTGHRANILDNTYDQGGIGIARVNDYFVVTQAFIHKVDCGYLGSSCCEADGSRYCYEPFSCYKKICIG
jgi:uncharacterized protein YkwD